MADASSVLVYIGHRDLTHFARVGRIRIDDVLNDAPNTAALSVVLTPKLAPSFTGPFAAPAFNAGGFNTADGPLVMTTPTVAVGAPVGIYLNGGADQIFGGEVLTREQYAEYDRPLASHVRLDLNCTDFTRRLNYRKVSKDYGTQSATAIVLDILANFAPTIGASAVEAGLPALSGGITFTFEDVSRALSRIAEKIGAYWYVDYQATLHFFTGTEPGATPAPIVPGGRFADLKIKADLSQVRTRVLVEGDGATVALTLPAGDTILPVSQVTPFSAAGGLATMAAARIAYSGINPGGAKTNTTGTTSGGSAAGPPPAAPGAPTATVAAPSNPGGLAGGPYYYRCTFELSDGSRSDVGPSAGPITIASVATPTATNGYVNNPPTKGPIAVGVTSIYASTFVDAAGRETAAGLGGVTLTGRAVPAPVSSAATGNYGSGSIAAGAYRYAVTYVTPAGETLPNFTADVGTSANSGILVTFGVPTDGRVVVTRIYRSSVGVGTFALPWRHVVDVPQTSGANSYADTTADANLPTKNYPAFSTATDVGEGALVYVPTSADARIVRRRVYRKDGPGEYRLVAELADNSTGSFNDVVVGPGGGIAPTVGNIGSGAVSLSSIAIGLAGTIRRRVFRTAANGTQYRELVSLEDNATTTYLDATPDANLGGAPQPPLGTPATAGIVPPTPAGRDYIQVVPGPIATFPAAGWVLLESGMMIRYTAIDTSGGFLGGIPTSGLGSITADIPNGSIVTVVAALVGVSPVLGVTLGDAVQLLAQVDDVPAQTALAAIEGGDGIIEHYIQDRRLSQAGALARGLAELALFKTVETQLQYTTHDLETRSGRTVHCDLPAPTNLTGDFLIQRVTIDDVSIAANWNPKRHVQASTTRFSFDDVLARILLEQS